MDVEERLLSLANSFADHVSMEDVDTFKAQVYARLGLQAPSTTASETGGVDRQVGPSGAVFVKEDGSRSRRK